MANFKQSHRDLHRTFCSISSPENQEHLEICGGTKDERKKWSGYVEMARNLNILYKDDSEADIGNSKEKEE